MRKKNKIIVRIIAIILAAAMIAGSGFYLIYIIGDAGSVAYGADADTEAYEKLDRLKQIIQTIEKNYKEDIDVSTLVDAAYDGVFASLDSWSEYYASLADEQSFTNELQNEDYSGVGLTIQKHSSGAKVIQVNPSGGAFDAGVKKGDIISHINGASVKDWDIDKISASLRGSEGTKVKITVLRNGQSMDFTLVRKKLSAASVSYEILDNKIGYIEISNFNSGEGEQFKSALSKIDEQGITKLIIDLRDNPGGYVSEALECLSAIMSPGKTLIRYLQQGKEIDKVYLVGRSDQEQQSYEIVLLINENSASASEIMAIALQGNKAATLVGTTSYGKGVAQQIFSLGSSGDSMKLSSCYFVGPNYEAIDGVGIKPDYIVYNGAELDAAQISEIVSGIIPMNEAKKYIELNSYGLNVLAAQQRLAVLGYEVQTSSILDRATMNALADVQKNGGLYPYGGLDYSTMKLLDQQFSSYLYGDSDAQLAKAIELLK